jgi:hypothetical protein
MRRSILNVAFAIALFAGLSGMNGMFGTAFGQAAFPPELPSMEAGETSEFEIYGMMTQIGTTARRTVRSRSGRIVREVYYGGSGFSGDPSSPHYWVPPAEKDLHVQSISVYFYDKSNRIDHIEHWQSGERRPRVEHNVYDAKGELVRKWMVETDGVRRYEMRFRDDRKFADLYFDDTGSYLTSILGHVVSDIDLPHGWGKVSGGLACGITLSTERARFDKFELVINIKNVAADTLFIDDLAETSFELVDAWGRMVAARAITTFEKKGHHLWGGPLDQDEVAFTDDAYKLSDYFDALPPGRYTIRIRQPVPERKVTLVSNDVTFEVLEAKPTR